MVIELNGFELFRRVVDFVERVKRYWRIPLRVTGIQARRGAGTRTTRMGTRGADFTRTFGFLSCGVRPGLRAVE